MSSKSKRRHQSAQKSGASASKGTVAVSSATGGSATPAPAKTYVKAAPKPAPAPVKKRGGWLTAMIVIIAIHAVISLVAVFSMRKVEYVNAPWMYAVAGLVALASLAGAIGLWYWKRWGLWLYVAATFVSTALGLIVFRTQWAAFYNLIPLLILAYILQGQKKMQLLT